MARKNSGVVSVFIPTSVSQFLAFCFVLTALLFVLPFVTVVFLSHPVAMVNPATKVILNASYHASLLKVYIPSEVKYVYSG